MRKALIAAIVAAALFAVGAFAAEFTLNAEDVASGTDAVDNCTESVDIDFEETFHDASNDWYVSDIDITLDPTNTCGTADLTLVIQDDSDAAVLTQEAVLAGTLGGAAPDPAFAPDCAALDAVCAGDGGTKLMVSQVWNAAVLIDGVEYTPLP